MPRQQQKANGKPNWKNRTLFLGDNLFVMQGMNSRTVDLIATDPPFNKGKDFYATPESLAEGASFQDRWRWEEDVHTEWVDGIRDDYPAVMNVIETARKTSGDDMGAFLCFMAVRLLEMHRILKTTGSLYLHCDPTASHYLRTLLDAIFGRKQFVNELVWYYKNASRGKKQFAKSHENLLWYSKSSDYTFERDEILVPFESEMTKWRYKKGGQKGSEMPKGKTPDDVIVMSALNAMDKERTGHPTQKPVALYEKIIAASSRRGEIVLDPFAGCATTLVAAENLGRAWVGIEIWDKAHDTVTDRLTSEKRALVKGQTQLAIREIKLVKKPPTRDDKEKSIQGFDTPEGFSILKEPWEKLTNEKIVSHLAEAQKALTTGDLFGEKVVCAGCGREMEKEFMELDHIMPRKDGGPNHIRNRVLLCRPCNGFKSARLTISGLRDATKKRKPKPWMYDENAAKNALKRAQKMADKVVRILKDDPETD